MKVGIIGAGYAGIAAAEVIADANIGVTVFSAEKVLPYHRPQLPKVAFGYKSPEEIFINKPEWYSKKNIDIRLDSKIKSFTRDFEVVSENGDEEKFDALIVASGLSPFIPPWAENLELDKLFTLWNYSDALKINQLVKTSKHASIIGSGLVGTETALRANDKDLDITVIEAQTCLLHNYFGKKASKVIEAQLSARNILLLLGHDVSYIHKLPNGRIEITLEDQDGFICDFAILTTGSTFNTSLFQAADLKTDRGIIVDEYLQTSAQGIFAAGDIAQFSVNRPCSAKEAKAQGKIAGKNVLAFMNSGEMQAHDLQPVPIHMKYKDFEIYSLGQVPEIGKEENTLDSDTMEAYRSCTYENAALTGVQMVGTEKDAKKFYDDFLTKTWKRIIGK